MSEKKELTLKDLWDKALPVVFTTMVLAMGKASFDVYAFSQTKAAMIKKLEAHDEKLLMFGSALGEKADDEELRKVDKKLDKVITILCTMNKNKPTDCIK